MSNKNIEIKPGEVVTINGVEFTVTPKGTISAQIKEGEMIIIKAEQGWETSLIGTSKGATLANGASFHIPGRKGWWILLDGVEDGVDLRHNNPAEDGRLKFCEYSTVGNAYGAGATIQEPSLRIPFKDIGIEGEGFIVGAILKDENGKTVGRFSLSNLVFFQNRDFRIEKGGEVFVDGKSVGFVNVPFAPDKNRLIGDVAYCSPYKTPDMTPREIEDIVFEAFMK